jgi:hypothetical protein
MPPSLVPSVSGKLRIPKCTPHPHTLKRNEHMCMVRSTFCPQVEIHDPTSRATPRPPRSSTASLHSATIQLDPDNVLPEQFREQFRDTLTEFDSVFDPNIKGYNGDVGPFQDQVNMGPA